MPSSSLTSAQMANHVMEVNVESSDLEHSDTDSPSPISERFGRKLDSKAIRPSDKHLRQSIKLPLESTVRLSAPRGCSLAKLMFNRHNVYPIHHLSFVC